MSVRIRMYRHGLGDCFLVTFHPKKAPRHLLIDCGVILGTKNAQKKMKEVLGDVLKETGGKVHAIVATHEHWDHVSGFVQAKDEFSKLKTDELWFAWTEAPHDKLANSLRKTREAKHAKIRAALQLWSKTAAYASDDERKNVEAQIGIAESVLGFFGEPTTADALGAAGRPGTADAMAYLKTERKEAKRFLEPGTSFALEGVDDVRVFVLGPPRDEAALKKLLPSKREPETYGVAPLTLAGAFFAAVDAADSPEPALPEEDAFRYPFDSSYRITGDDLARDVFYTGHYANGPEWQKIDLQWLSTARDLALALDNETNNTSLVLAFEIGVDGPVLLFPGDAQVGNWLSWADMEFRVPGRGKVTTGELLERTTFYKVGHHASHNATLREHGLERMTHEDLQAMIPVFSAMARQKGWGQMPFRPLLKRLDEKTKGRVLRSDRSIPAEADLRGLGAKARATFKKNATEDPLYFDLVVVD